MFVHLHVHTEYSLLDGMSKIPDLIKRARELGMESLAITDHGVMHGVIQFYLAAKEAGIKPIIGCEVYVAPSSRLSREPGDKNNYHLILLAKNQTGYQNLLKLTTKAHLEGFYYKPRVDKELLSQHHEGLIALSACLGGEISRLVLEGRIEEAKEAARWYKETFDDYYIELQRQPTPESEQVNQVLIPMGQELEIPLVATNDLHYVKKEDAPAHELLLCIQTNTSISDEKRMKMAGDFFYLKSPEEMSKLFEDIPEAIENTGRIADMCQLELEFGRLHLPEIELPKGKTPDQFLGDLCWESLSRYYPEPTEEIKERLRYELEVIEKTEFANYFLVVWDIVSFAKEQNIFYGVRGSAAASIVLHCLGITTIDPIEHKLVFERFLNLERKEMPDIDLDFEDERRDEAIAYVSQKYGNDHVAQIITFGTLGARAALRDVGRALGMSYSDVDRVTKLVPFSPTMTLDRALEENGELKSIYSQDPIIHNLVDSAKKVEGIARHASTHAAGVVISKEPLARYVPLQQVSKGNAAEQVMTQFAMEDIARIGLLKMDFLGLANLTILGRAKEIILQNTGTEIDLDSIPVDDKKTFELLSSGETTGVFQLEGSGMRRYISELKPTTFSDIAAMIALFRPGPMEHIPTFIKAKHGLEPIRYPHPALQKILEETYGVIVYQDQVLFIVRALAGYSLGQADIFRKAMGKKIPEVMKKERRNFITGAKKNGFSTEDASAVFDLIEPFAGYAFNKAHSTSYALIAYQTAYFKANYPIEYMTAFLITQADQQEKISSAVAECQRLDIKVLPPDINHSQMSFSIEKTSATDSPAIRFGLAAIKNVGSQAIAPVLAERNKNGEYKSIEDLCQRADLHSVNKRALESLIKAGVFDSLGSRGALLNNIDRIMTLAQSEQRRRSSGQTAMFDLWGQEAALPAPDLKLETDDIPLKEKLAWEKELTGVYLSEHPLSTLANRAAGENTTFCGQIDASMEGQAVKVAGMLTSVRCLSTRDRRPFASAILEDISGRIEVMAWPRVFETTQEFWQEGNTLVIEGKVRRREERLQLSCNSVRYYESGTEKTIPSEAETAPAAAIPKASQTPRQRLVISLTQTRDEESDRTSLYKVFNTLRDFPGEDEARLCILNGTEATNLRLSCRIGYCPELHKQLARLIGEEGLTLEE